MKKKGFVKTIEVMVAILMSFVFLVIIVPTNQNVAQKINLGILEAYGTHEVFRNCALAENEGCIIDIIGSQIPPYLEYEVLIATNVNEQPDLPAKKVSVETYYVAANMTTYDPKIVKLFYWQRE